MRKIAIVYASRHHGNTLQLLKAISGKYDITLIDAVEGPYRDLEAYELIGFASGIDFGKFYEPVEQFLRSNLPVDKQVFFLYTCARTHSGFTRSVRLAAEQKNATVLGEYGCKGYNTYGPWKLIGGMNKHHPSEDELADAVCFFESLL